MDSRLIPQNLDAEQGLLGSMMLGGHSMVAEVLPIVGTPAAFVGPGHGRLFSTLVEMYRASDPIDLTTMAERMVGVDGPITGDPNEWVDLIVNIIESTPSWLNGPRYAEIVRSYHSRRQIIAAAHRLANAAYDVHANPDPAELSRAAALELERIENPAKPVPTDVAKIMEEMAQLEAHGESIEYRWQTGITGIDHPTGGIPFSGLTIIGASASTGKTAMALFIARWVSTYHEGGWPAVFFSLEMTRYEITNRVRMMEGQQGFPLDRLHVVDGVSNVRDLVSKARMFKDRHGVGLVVVDYLQLVETSERFDTRNAAIDSHTRTFKKLAAQLPVSVILLSQLSRDSVRENRAPRLSDLRESGAIEQHADMVILAWWPDKQKEFRQDVAHLKVAVAKNRNGRTAECGVAFHRPTMTFESEATWDVQSS